jgi:hypothetical protein
MSVTIPTFQDNVDLAVSNYETALGQDAPLTPKAFMRILGFVQSLMITGLYKTDAERVLQNLALTATEENLEILGAEYGITRQPAVAAQLEILCTGGLGDTIPAGTIFIGDANGLEYYSQVNVGIVAGLAQVDVTCFTSGVDSQLETLETMTLSTPLTGIGNSAPVIDNLVDGVDQEDIEVYRRRVLDAIQTVGGGSNSADFRAWAVPTPDVYRAFPYSGTPVRMSADLIDWDMELVGITNWTLTGTSPVVTKETGTSPGDSTGVQVLRIERGVDTAGAYQNVFKLYNTYTITGWARGDGNCNPSLLCGGVPLWTGTSSTSWQAISATVTVGENPIHGVRLSLNGYGGASGHYVEFDDIVITQEAFPGHVTVYIEADTSIDADGIPTSTELAAADNPSLGLVDDNLFVEPIIRTPIYVEIRGLDVAAELETQAKADLTTNVDAYLRNATPYIQGLDSQSSQADQITDPLISKVIQDVLDSYGATATGIGIGIVADVFLASYSLGAGELAKLESITYV